MTLESIPYDEKKLPCKVSGVSRLVEDSASERILRQEKSAWHTQRKRKKKGKCGLNKVNKGTDRQSRARAHKTFFLY